MPTTVRIADKPAAEPVKRAVRTRGMSTAAKHRRIAELLQDINEGLDQLARTAEARRNQTR